MALPISRKRITYFLKRSLSLILCITLILTNMPIQANAAVTIKKFIKANPSVFVPSDGETADITWNFENTHVANVMIMNGTKVIDYLAKDKKYEGNYKIHKLTWDGKDQNGKIVEAGTYSVVVEPQEAIYKKYKSITSITVLNDNSQEISIAPLQNGNTFKVYGMGGSKQGVSKVTLAITKDGEDSKSIDATIVDNLWYATLPMSAYSLYDIKATISKNTKNTTKTLSAIRHVFRFSDRMVYLASAYYGDYTKDDVILLNNNLSGQYKNEGELVKSNVLILNPSKKVQQEIKLNSDTTKQHLGVIDQIQRTASTNPVSLSMGNSFYTNEDISIDGFIPLTFTRVYNSLSHSFNEFGMNWSHSYNYCLQNNGKTIAIQFDDGHMEYYTKDSTGKYVTSEGLVRDLKVNADKTYTLTVNGTQYYNFGVDGSLLNIKDLNGNTTTLTYTKGMLTKVENISGYFNITYNTDGTIQTITDSGNRRVGYTYENGQLTKLSNVNGYVRTYSYDSLSRLDKVVSPEGVTELAVKYDTSDRATSKSIFGSTYKYSYNDAGRTIICTEPNGNKITFRYTQDYRIESEEYSDGTVKYYYKDGSEKTETTEKTESTESTNTAVVAATNLSSDSKAEKTSNLSMETKVSKETARSINENTVVLLSDRTGNPDLELETHNMNTAIGSATNNTLYPKFRIINNGSTSVSLSDITLRYYYTVDGEKPQNFWCDWSSAGMGNVTGKFVKLESPTSTADYYLEVGFTSGTVKPGETVETHIRIAKNDWSVFTPGNDYSQNLSNGFTSFDKVDMFFQGNLIWGKGSLREGYVTTGEDDPDEKDNGKPEETSSSTSSEDSSKNDTQVTGVNYQLKLQMYNTGNSGATTNTIHPMMRLVNTGKNMVKLSDVTIRYYYTTDDKKTQNFWCDWSSVGQQNIKGTFHTMAEPTDKADTYLEVSFLSGAGYIDIGGQVDIHIRIAKNDWTNYDITNDYSLRAAESFADWDKVDVFVKGEKVWGEGIIPGDVVVKTEEEYIDYADTTYTPVRVEMYNTNKESRSSALSPRFRIYNTGTEAFKLSDLNIVYFYTTDGPEKQIFEVDWVGVGSKFQTGIGKGDITCDFTEVGEDNLATNCAANIGFTRNDIKLQPGEYLELHVRIHREAWTNYVQNNDYSLNPEASTYEEWSNIAVFVNDKWAYGSLPLTYAMVIDPNPDREEVYPVDTQGSYGSNTDKSGNASYYSYDDNGNITTNVDSLGNKTEYTYNKFNQTTSITDAKGNETTYDYDSKGNLTTVTDALGNKTNLTYNSLGCLTMIELEDGSSQSATYDSKGNLITSTDANGNTISFQYDSLNRITQYRDGKGNTEIYDYMADGNIAKVTDALGYTLEFEYNKDGQTTKEINENKKVTQYQYSTTTGLLIQVTDALSGVVKYQYDSMGKLTKTTKANGSVTTYEYDLFGRTTAVTDGEGGKTSYTLDVNGNVTKEIDSLGNVNKYAYDQLNRLVSYTDGEGAKTTYEYDNFGRNTKVIDALGGVTAYKYDELGNLLQITDAMGNVVKQEYSKVGLLTSYTDAEGNKTTYEYDAGGRQTKQINPIGGILSWTYDENDNLTEERDELGNTVTYTYDKLDRLTKITDALGKTTIYKYDGVGNKTEVTDALGNTTTFQYDALNNLKQVTDALGNATKYEYDKMGQLTKEINPLGNSLSYEYDKNGNQVRVTDTLGYSTSFTYDNLNRLVEKKDALGNKIAYTYDRRGNRLTEKDSKGNVTTYDYDSLGNLTKVKDALGHISEYTYDKLGNRIKNTRIGASDSQTTSYQYNKNGNRILLTDPVGKTISYEYNNMGQLVKETAKDGSATKYEYDKAGNVSKKTYGDNRSISYIYDKNNRLTLMTDWNGTTEYSYDALGQTIKVTDPKKQTVTYTWTKTGQKSTMTYPDGNQIQYDYDKAGNLIQVTDTNKGVTTYTYDNNSQLKAKKLPNGGESSYTYDGNGQLTGRVEKSGSSIKATYTYEYDANSNRTKEIKVKAGSTQTTTYTYDSLNQLIKVSDTDGTRTYTYDEFNNRTSKEESGKDKISYTYNSLNELITQKQGSNIKKYTYDVRGNLSEETVNGITTVIYTFDSCNMLSKVQSIEENTVTEYTYDGANNRTQATVTKGYQLVSKKEYVSDTETPYQDIIVAKDALTAEVSNYTHGNGLVSVETNDSISYYRIDEKDNVEEILSSAATVQAEIRYDEFGNVKNPEAVSISRNIFAYTGHAYEESTGLYYAKARYYNPSIGRFISEDSYEGNINTLMSLNLYIYCHNNPVLYTDPSGHKVKWNQWDNLIGAFIKTGWEITKGRMFPTDPVSGWKNFKAMKELFEGVISGEITLKDLADMGINAAIGDIKYVISNWHIITDKKTYSNEVISSFGSHLAGAYEELVSIGMTLYAVVQGVKTLADKIKGASKTDVNILGKGSTGRSVANNLNEQLAMKEVISNPLENATKVPLKNGMTDSRWLGTDGWTKMQRVITTSDGKNITIHFNYNDITGAFDDFKFK